MTKTIFREKIFNKHFIFLVCLMSHPLNMEGAGLMTYTATGHQGAINMFSRYFRGTVMLSIFMYSLYDMHLMFGHSV